VPRYILLMQPAVTPPPPPVARSRFSFKRLLLVLLLLAAAFLGGYVPQALRARRLNSELTTAQLDLRLSQLHRRIGIAAEEAQRNNFANASLAARDFFDGCSTLATTEAFANQPRTRNAISAYATQRDEIMTQLANADPAVKERLANMYLVMDGVLARRE